MKKHAPKIYRTTNWSTFNRALINRGNIAIWFDPKTQWYAQPKSKHGRNQTYSDAAIQCCLMIKSLFRLSLRMMIGFVQSLIKLCGLDWVAPEYSIICRRQKHIDIQICYEKSCNGLHLLIYSTGLKFLGEGEWKRKKHQPEYRKFLGIYLIKSRWMSRLIQSTQMGLMIQNNAVRSFQIGKHMQLFHPEKMQSPGKIQRLARESEMNYFEQLNI